MEQRQAKITTKPHERRRRHRVINSCLECRRRKLKCDKGEVCVNCRTHGRQCIYISTAAGDSHLRQKLAQVKDARDSLDKVLLSTTAEGAAKEQQSRRDQLLQNSNTPIASVEGELDGNGAGNSDDESFLEPTPLAIPDAAYAANESDEFDDLGFLLGRMRLGDRVGGLYRPRIGDEIGQSLHNQSPRSKAALKTTKQQINSAASSSRNSLEPPDVFAVPSMAVILGATPSDGEWIALLPSRTVSDRLLEHYWFSVHPVARTLHRPTFAQRYETLWELMDARADISASLGAIVLAVLFSAVVSMDSEDVSIRISSSKQELCSRLQLGVELALSQANLLRSNKMETLQAFVTYLLPTCLDISRAHSALVGLAIRLAECMGYHRDPSEYGFSPSECQVRRLIWYQICYLDLKTSDTQGPRPFVQSNGYSTKLPLEINPRAASSSPTPGPVTRWSELVFSAIRFECQEMQRSCLVMRKRIDLKKLSLIEVISKIERFNNEMHEKYDSALNEEPQQPLQHAARVVMKLFISLLYLAPLHRYMNSVTYSMPDRLRQIVLVKGTEALEAALELETAHDLRPWAWYSRAYQQYHTALLLLFEVFTFPLRREADRIWRCLDFIFAGPLANFTDLPALGNPPKYHEVLTLREAKGRYLLCAISTGMQEYSSRRGLRSPVTMTDSMILVSPRKAGEDSDPSRPLNFAHGMPADILPRVASQFNTRDIASESNPFNVEVSLEQHEDGTINNKDIPQFLWAPALDTPITLHAGHQVTSDFSHVDTSIPGPGYLHHTTVGSQTTSTSAYSQPGYIVGPGQEMLDIDWGLWDTMFPPGVFDGNLDLSDVDMEGYAVV
ncbi:hypothetical protein BGW36DRAFT_309164 [Talaromyces proteolyticus]|uniref:Zn(2)-C6 fungal-type domain-containing protein n=1 Tax=Talaromyces proteolyticus TaxID=1131652 RepID=A0AAD4KIG6_9EURO|nr:uncharacterized protein BGW36DRAFT_309164 [Talaromyces proteolyticus]KAH8689096.1 hypothetical protein BGW36DRAFT_309164 [Talaromyces proteolyticus]